MSQQNFQNRRKPNALSEYKLRLSAKPVNGGRRSPTFGVVVVKNQPHLLVRTNVEGDKNFGKIEAKLDTPTFFALIHAIKTIAQGENGKRIQIENMGHPFTNGQRSKEPKLDTKILIGKSTEGVVWIAVTSWERDRPIIQFPFTPSQYHNWGHGDGTPMTEAEVSQIYAPAFATILAEIVPQILVTEYVEPEPRPDNNQQRGGGGGYSGGGSGGTNSGYSGGGGGHDPIGDGLPM